MKVMCDVVVERVAHDEPLGELANHVKACSRCRRLVEMPAKLAAARQAERNRRGDGEAGLGFSARMTAGAQQRLAARHRRRIVGGVAAVMAAGVAGVFVVTAMRASDRPNQSIAAGETERLVDVTEPQPRPVVAAPGDLQMLVNLSDTRRAMRVSAPWGRIERPLRPYKQLVKGVAP